jgi:hypothetical protein
MPTGAGDAVSVGETNNGDRLFRRGFRVECEMRITDLELPRRIRAALRPVWNVWRVWSVWNGLPRHNRSFHTFHTSHTFHTVWLGFLIFD